MIGILWGWVKSKPCYGLAFGGRNIHLTIYLRAPAVAAINIPVCQRLQGDDGDRSTWPVSTATRGSAALVLGELGCGLLGDLPSGKLTVCYGTSSFSMCKSTISMAMLKSKLQKFTTPGIPKSMPAVSHRHQARLTPRFHTQLQLLIPAAHVREWRHSQWKIIGESLENIG